MEETGFGNRFYMVVFAVPAYYGEKVSGKKYFAFENEEKRGLKIVARGLERRILNKKMNNVFRTAIIYDNQLDGKEVAKWINGTREF